MRHNVGGRQFGRHANHRKALLRNLVTSLLEQQRVETTLAKAKETKKIAERLITLGIKGDLAARRRALQYVYKKSAVANLFEEIAPRMKGRPGGYLRLVKTRVRPGDCSPMAVLEFVDFDAVRTAREEAAEKSKG